MCTVYNYYLEMIFTWEDALDRGGISTADEENISDELAEGT